MGIRYYAYPVLATDLEKARKDPLHYMNHNPIVYGDRDPFTEDVEIDEGLVLSLEKSWRELQILFVWPNQTPSDPCLPLVAGDVHYPDGHAEGYLCHYEILSPDQVRVIAAHIKHVDKVDVLAMYMARRPCTRATTAQAIGFHEDERLRQDVSSVGYHLELAKTFVARLAEAGYGLVYRIG